MHEVEYLRSIESSARTYASTFPKLFTRGRGVRVQDANGNEYIDCLAVAGALALGHNHPEVNASVQRFLASEQLQQGLDLATPAKFEFVSRLFSVLPPPLRDRSKVQFCSPSGSDAVEAAFKLARIATQRATILAFHGAYHGMTSGALAAMGNLGPKVAAGVAGPNVHFIPYPHRYRCPFSTDGSETERLTLEYLRQVLGDPESGISKPAALILEVIQGEGGCIPASDEWMRGVREITKVHGVLLIVDEVQTGFGRTGHMFAHQPSCIVPDILVLSKAVGGGYPLAAIVYDSALDVWPRGAHAGTFRGNQIGMVAGRETIQIIERDALAAHAERMGGYLMQGLRELAQRYAFLADVRGRGLMVGVECSASAGGRASARDGELARAIRSCAFEEGLIVETGGRHGAVLRFLPPLIVTESDVEQIIARMTKATARVA